MASPGRRRFLLGCMLYGLALEARPEPPAISAMPFSSLRAGAALPKWLEPYAFESSARRTRFDLVSDEGRTVLRARSEASTSGLIRTLRADPAVHPLLAWRWKVMNLIDGADLARKEGDDFPARLYVTFDLDPSAMSLGERMQLSLARSIWSERIPAAALCYVWDSHAPAGTIAPNAYTDRVRMIVLESGPARLGQWIGYERNVAEDYRRAFGIRPGVSIPPVNGVVVSSDTDNTGGRAEAYFGDVTFRSRRSS